MRILALGLVILVTALGFAPITDTVDGVSTLDPVMGLPVLCVGGNNPCWLTLGAGTGILVIGVAGAGVVCISLYGAGVLFATGQIAAGGIAFGQAGAAFSLFVGQAGGAFSSLAQVAVGVIARGQGALGINGEGFFSMLLAEVNQILRFRGPLPRDMPPDV